MPQNVRLAQTLNDSFLKGSGQDWVGRYPSSSWEAVAGLNVDCGEPATDTSRLGAGRVFSIAAIRKKSLSFKIPNGHP